MTYFWNPSIIACKCNRDYDSEFLKDCTHMKNPVDNIGVKCTELLVCQRLHQ